MEKDRRELAVKGRRYVEDMGNRKQRAPEVPSLEHAVLCQPFDEVLRAVLVELRAPSRLVHRLRQHPMIEIIFIER